MTQKSLFKDDIGVKTLYNIIVTSKIVCLLSFIWIFNETYTTLFTTAAVTIITIIIDGQRTIHSKIRKLHSRDISSIFGTLPPETTDKWVNQYVKKNDRKKEMKRITLYLTYRSYHVYCTSTPHYLLILHL